jgi:hypothetical protein
VAYHFEYIDGYAFISSGIDDLLHLSTDVTKSAINRHLSSLMSY